MQQEQAAPPALETPRRPALCPSPLPPCPFLLRAAHPLVLKQAGVQQRVPTCTPLSHRLVLALRVLEVRLLSNTSPQRVSSYKDQAAYHPTPSPLLVSHNNHNRSNHSSNNSHNNRYPQCPGLSLLLSTTSLKLSKFT